MNSKFIYTVFASLGVCFAVSCRPRDYNSTKVTDTSFHYADNKTAFDPHWIYNGPLPHLSDVQMVASLKSNTLRVTGFAPNDYDTSKLPYYAVLDKINGRNRITVAYPIATADIKHPNPEERGENSPGMYSSLLIFPYTPFGSGSKKNAGTTWGGFPFVGYVGAEVGFHGPIKINKNGSDWHLWRGSVSHGCNRMQGEHVVELAHLVGVDMLTPHGAQDAYSRRVNLVVTEDFDVIPDGAFAGKKVDVDYPIVKDDSAIPDGIRSISDLSLVSVPPAAEAKKFFVWDAKDFPRFVCEYDKSRPLDKNHCNYKPANSDISKPPHNSPNEIGLRFPPQLVKGVGKSNGKICTESDPFINLRGEFKNDDGELIVTEEPVGIAEKDSRVWASGEKITRASDGLLFRKVYFEKDHAPNVGYVADQFFCRD